MKYLQKYKIFESTQNLFIDEQDIKDVLLELIEEDHKVKLERRYYMNNSLDNNKFVFGDQSMGSIIGYYPGYYVNIVYMGDKHDFKRKSDYFKMLDHLLVKISDREYNLFGDSNLDIKLIDSSWKTISYNIDEVQIINFMRNIYRTYPSTLIMSSKLVVNNKNAIIELKQGISVLKINKYLNMVKQLIDTKFPILNYKLDITVSSKLVTGIVITPIGSK